MSNMVAIAQANKVVPVLVTMGHGPWHPSISMTAQINREVAKDKGALLVDFEPLSRPGWFAGDNIHLTRDGNFALASAVADVVGGSNPAFTRRAK
jgi:hypothetical protein